ncbi:DedA family protein [Candidatus Parcubacteria bacterium]|nr:DedA family protein [Candidatus Parcubacteria bacterium]
MMDFVNLLLEFSEIIGYFGIIFLMAIESSFIPFPSEVVIPPAAFLAAQGEFNIYLVVLFGILGSLIGALINYYLALTLGRKVVFSLAETKTAKLFLVTPKKIERAEKYFLKYGNISTFVCRLVPAVRQLISIPAGFSKMKIRNFLFFTFLGSSTWIIILAILGYVFGANEELMHYFYKNIKIICISLFALIVLYVFIKKILNKKSIKQ